MKILHITPHLGGGVGKAHAALAAVFPKAIERTFLLLEEPRDRRHADAIVAAGGAVVVGDLRRAADLAADADIVQFEFWNHPRLFECLARAAFPPMRTVFWSHISGLFPPLVPMGLIERAGRFVFTTEASRAIATLADLPKGARERLAVVNSGFGFDGTAKLAREPAKGPPIAYLGTADFVKMHPGFFDAIDRLGGSDVRAAVWGEASESVKARARAMRHLERIELRGPTKDPAAALAGADIFFYPLQPSHYGTAENALVEAMSIGLVPVVLNNPAEVAIVRHGETGFVARSIEECTVFLQMLTASPELARSVGRNAMRNVAETRAPIHAARALTQLWLGLLGEPKRACQFGDALGATPADWFLSTQPPAGEFPEPDDAGTPAKGTLAHFRSVFPDDPSLSALVRVQAASNTMSCAPFHKVSLPSAARFSRPPVTVRK